MLACLAIVALPGCGHSFDTSLPFFAVDAEDTLDVSDARPDGPAESDAPGHSDTRADPAPDAQRDIDPATDAAGETTDAEDEDAPDVEGWAGAACENDLDCADTEAGALCVNREYLDVLGVDPEIDLPGGMCSMLLCASDDECGPNAVCFSASVLGAPGIRICGRACAQTRDCQRGEGWECLPQRFIEADAGGGVCVSTSLKDAICAEGSCDE